MITCTSSPVCLLWFYSPVTKATIYQCLQIPYQMSCSMIWCLNSWRCGIHKSCNCITHANCYGLAWFCYQVPFCNPMKVASSVENIWVPEVDSEERAELVDSLWLSSGASGMKVWLTLSTQVFHNLFWTYVSADARSGIIRIWYFCWFNWTAKIPSYAIFIVWLCWVIYWYSGLNSETRCINKLIFKKCMYCAYDCFIQLLMIAQHILYSSIIVISADSELYV